MSDITFNKRTALITGSGGGLGKTYALDFARRGANIVINDLNKEAADAVVNEIVSSGGKAVATYDSVTSIAAGEKMVKTALDSFGSIDILINNAGIVRDNSFVKMSEADWDSVQAVHLKGAFSVTRPAFMEMKKNNYGRIIFTISGAGLYGNYGQSNYAAAKLGLLGLMNVLKIEGAKYGIKLNAIAPIAATGMTEGVLPPNIFEKMGPEYISPMVQYLCSEDVTESGGIYNCAGGWYSKSEIVCSPGIIISQDKKIVTPEDVRSAWKEINDMEGARPLSNIAETFSFFSTLFS